MSRCIAKSMYIEKPKQLIIWDRGSINLELHDFSINLFTNRVTFYSRHKAMPFYSTAYYLLIVTFKLFTSSSTSHINSQVKPSKTWQQLYIYNKSYLHTCLTMTRLQCHNCNPAFITSCRHTVWSPCYWKWQIRGEAHSSVIYQLDRIFLIS